MSRVGGPSGLVNMGTNPELGPPSAARPFQPLSTAQMSMGAQPAEVTVSAGTAFKLGFFGAFGWLGANILIGLIALIGVFAFGSCMLAAFHR